MTSASSLSLIRSYESHTFPHRISSWLNQQYLNHCLTCGNYVSYWVYHFSYLPAVINFILICKKSYPSFLLSHQAESSRVSNRWTLFEIHTIFILELLTIAFVCFSDNDKTSYIEGSSSAASAASFSLIQWNLWRMEEKAFLGGQNSNLYHLHFFLIDRLPKNWIE